MKTRKLNGNISIMVTVFCVTFLVFCAFAIDMAYITLNRSKLQRAVETTALASIAEYKNTGEDKSNEFFNFYKTKFDLMKNAQISQSEYKDEVDGIKKVKITANLICPTFFLRFTGIGKINIKANSYAQSYEQVINDIKSGELIELEDILTDKSGYDIKIETTNLPEGYFIFAGIKNENGILMWADIGCKADKTTVQKQIYNDYYNLITDNNANFDLSKDCEPSVYTNIVSYLKLFKANPLYTDNYSFKVTILNNVKLITKNDF